MPRLWDDAVANLGNPLTAWGLAVFMFCGRSSLTRRDPAVPGTAPPTPQPTAQHCPGAAGACEFHLDSLNLYPRVLWSHLGITPGNARGLYGRPGDQTGVDKFARQMPYLRCYAPAQLSSLITPARFGNNSLSDKKYLNSNF